MNSEIVNVKALSTTINQLLRLIVKSTLLFILIIVCVIGDGSKIAIALPLQSTTFFATSASSLSREAKGQSEQMRGTVQNNVGEVKGKLDGKANEIKGRVQQDLGRAQSAAEDTRGNIRKQANNSKNEAKIAADNVGARITNASENAVEDVREFFEK